ncbi:hypothetical protein BJ742DRAFT_883296 [Cladochytrium replicatum]|nr:hypothetical protein BJ742DRAFT_883296 [Cladochytrium replicatum]
MIPFPKSRGLNTQSFKNPSHPLVSKDLAAKSHSNLAKRSRKHTLQRSIDMSTSLLQSRDSFAAGSRRNLPSSTNPITSLPDLREQRPVSASDAEKYASELAILAEDDATGTHERTKTIERENPISLVKFLKAGPQLPRKPSGENGKSGYSNGTLITQDLALSISGDIPTKANVPEVAHRQVFSPTSVSTAPMSL